MKTRENKLLLLGLTCGLAASTIAFAITSSPLVVYAEDGALTEEEIAELEAQAAAEAAAAEAAAAAAQAEAEAAAAAQAEAEAAAAQAEAEPAEEQEQAGEAEEQTEAVTANDETEEETAEEQAEEEAAEEQEEEKAEEQAEEQAEATEDAISTLSIKYIGDAQISGIDSAYAYTGEAITPSPVVTMDGQSLEEGTAYSLSYGENIKVGESSGSVTISGMGEYSGDIIFYFSIVDTEDEAKKENEDPSKTNIGYAEISGIDAAYVYTGGEIEPKPVVTLKGEESPLEPGKDYSITYESNDELGTASITITGDEEAGYVGEITLEFSLVETKDEADKLNAQAEASSKEAETSEGAEGAAFTIVGFSVDPNAYPAADASANTRYIYNYLTKTMGLNHAAACGVLANIQMESGFNPLALGDGGTSYGICQWHNERFNSLISYCNSIGLDYNTLDGQLANLNRELSGAYSGILAYIRSVPNTAQGAYDAGYYWCVNFEIPNDASAHGALRGNLAANNYFPLDLSSEEEIAEEEEEDPMTALRTDMSLQPDGWAASAEEDESTIFTFTERVLTNSAFK